MSAHTTVPDVLKLDVEHPGIYASVNLNGFILTSYALPSENATVILGYRVPHLPEVWFGMGYRCLCRGGGERLHEYWLGATGLQPNYHHLKADQVLMWRAVQMPFCFDDGRPGSSDYLQYRYVVGDAAWQTEEESKQERADAAITKATGGAA